MKKAPLKTPQPTRASAPQEVRILGGQWKRSLLPVLDRPGLRPTPSRVRETLFNWLGQNLSGWHCLDAFAGTGALGLEAASRGAAQVLLVEQDPAVVANLNKIKLRLKADTVRVERGDGVAALQQKRGQNLQLVLLDPPFAQAQGSGLVEAALLAARQAIAPNGWIYLESPAPWSDDELARLGLQIHRSGRAGAVAFQLLRLLLPE
ncbi:16S rRNA (guanine(966)-N(2))-methyltransferase RsmD [Hydrogenophaga sp.]|uniref:16S rRNA (guanine(966)-N(2))-methyltransferase RsmD n=1 Tax=Hydrogenophaga sp. TaxID=1904254 RepID=UPI003567BC3D